MKKILTHLIISTVLLLPTLTFAADFGLQNPVKVNSISELILIVTRVVRYIAIPFIVIMIMNTGFKFLWAYKGFSGVNEALLTEARKSVGYVIIGSFILLSAELIALVMKNTIESITK